ncbi:carboxypeptidase regulatory-like domain-containing protein, partial [candidate division KSB1 bacterium]|nr:carboxypeptidase regulatory-like domain-containing protein [candidate division KSB1 bacterium]
MKKLVVLLLGGLFLVSAAFAQDNWPPSNLTADVQQQVNVYLDWDEPVDPSAIELSYDDGVAENWWYISDPPAANQHMCVGFTYTEDFSLDYGKFDMSYDAGATYFEWNIFGGSASGPDIGNVLASGSTDLTGDAAGAWYTVDLGGLNFTAGEWFYLDINYLDGMVYGTDCYFCGGDASDIDPYSWYTVDGGATWTNLGTTTDVMFRAVISTGAGATLSLNPVSANNPAPQKELSNMPVISDELLKKFTSNQFANPQVNNAIDRDLLSYIVYKNDEAIATPTSSGYDDLDLADGTYVYYVTAFYDTGESEPTDPVSVTIAYQPESDIIDEDFEGGAIPAGWEMTTNSFQGWWVTTDGSSAYWTIPTGDGYYACSNDDMANDDGSVDYLITPEMNLSTYIGGTLRFDSYFTGDYSQTAHIEISVDGGSWVNIYNLGTGTAWTNIEVDFSNFCGAEFSNVRIAFHSNDGGYWASGWAVDNVVINGILGAFGTIEGYVYDDVSNPIEGASITIDESEYAVSGADGYYSFNLNAGTYDVTASKFGYETQTITGVEIVEDQTTQVDFTLAQVGTGILDGTVTDAENGHPIEGAEIVIEGTEYSAVSVTGGYYIIEDIYAGTYDVTCSAESYISQTEENVVITTDATTTLDFAIDFCVGTIIVCDLDTTPMGNQLVTALENLYGGTVVYETNLTANPLDESVTALFLLLGIYSSNYTLTEADAAIVTPYLDAGGNVYMEGGDTWAYDTATSLHGYFNITGLADGSGDLSSINGMASFWEGMSWSYTGENNWIDQLSAIAPAIDIMQNATVGYTCAVAYDANDYKTIGASFEITGMVDGNRESFEIAVANVLGYFGLIDFDYGNLTGYVYDLQYGIPVMGAIVYCGSYVGYTNSEGYYEINEILVGNYDLTCEADGYNVATAEDIEIVVDETTTYDFLLTSPTLEVDPLTISETMDPETTMTTYLTVSNNGNGPLDWGGSISTSDKTAPTYPSYTEILKDMNLNKIKSISSCELAPTMAPNSPLENSIPLRDEDSEAFAYMAYDPGGSIPAGPLSFILNNPGLLIPFGSAASDFLATADWVDDVWYGIVYGGSFISIDMETGEITTIGATVDATGMAYDWTTGTMYAADFTGGLYTIDLTDGSYTQIATTQANLITIACSNDGILYGFDLDTDTFGSIDKATGAWTQISSVGFDFSYAQDAAFDHSTNTLYWACYDVALGGELLTVDLETGATSLVGAFPNGAEVSGFAIPGAVDTWIGLEPNSGTLEAGSSEQVAVNFDSEGILPGTNLAAQINFSSDPDVGTETVDVDVIVGELTPGSISGTVTLNGGSGNVEDVLVELGPYSTSPAADGSYYINVYPGTYDLTATLDFYEDYFVDDIVVGEDEHLTQDITLTSFTTVMLWGQVVGNDAPAGLDGAFVELSGIVDYSQYTDGSGNFIFLEVYANNSYNVTISYEGYGDYEGTFVVGGTDYDAGVITLTESLFPPANLEVESAVEGALYTWETPGGGELFELIQHDGTYTNAYYQAYDMGYGVVYDISGYSNVTLEMLDFRHSSWGITGIWDYKVHIVDWDTYAELAVTDVMQTTGDDQWEESIPLGSIADDGLVGVFIESLSNDPADAYPCIDADNDLTGMSYFGDLSDYSSFAISEVGDFLLDLWIMGVGSRELVKAKVVPVEFIGSNNTRLPANIVESVTTGYTEINRSLQGYNVYLDGELKGFTTELEYLVTDIAGFEDYTAGVTALYSGDFESEMIEVDFTYEPPVNYPPVADAGNDMTVEALAEVILNGSDSYDPNGDNITYLWTAPAGITLDDDTAIYPTFTAPNVTEETDYTISLVVSDSEFDSDPDEVVITVTPPFAVITVGSANADIGESFDIAISTTELTEDDGIISFEFDLFYDSEIIEYTDFALTTMTDGGMAVVNDWDGIGKLSVSYMNMYAIVGADDSDIILLTFTGSAEGSTDVTIDEFLYNVTPVNAIPGEVVIGGDEIVYGDVDGDGYVYSFDAALVLQYSAGLTTFEEWQLIAGDVDGDGYVYSFDAALILQYSAGLIDEFPVEGGKASTNVD